MGEATKQLCIGLYSTLVFVLTFSLYYYALARTGRFRSRDGWRREGSEGWRMSISGGGSDGSGL